MAGFDGFGVSDPRQRESNSIFELFAEVVDASKITEWHEGDDRCRDLGCKVVENFSAWDSWTLSA